MPLLYQTGAKGNSSREVSIKVSEVSINVSEVSIKGSGCVGESRGEVANERVVLGKTYPVAWASSDAAGRATGQSKRSQRDSRAVY